MKNIHNEDFRGFSTEDFGGGYFYEEEKRGMKNGKVQLRGKVIKKRLRFSPP